LKSWTWIVVAAAASIFGFELSGQRAGSSAAGTVALQDTRPAAPRKPASPVQAPAPPPSFGGYPCISGDCTEDKAGFRWAENNAIVDADDCTGNSAAFIEGCRIYARQRPRRR
jgi:hypothetical protein